MITGLLNILGKRCNSGESSICSRLMTTIIKDILRYRYPIIRDNLKLCFGAEYQANLIKEYYQYLTHLILETTSSKYWEIEKIKSTVYIETDQLNKINDSKQQVVILCAHVGNWEVIIPSLPLYISRKVYGVYKPISNKKVDRWIFELRSRFGLILKPMEQIVRSFYTDKDGVFIFINDQSPPRGSTGSWIPFFGIDTLWHDGIIKLSRGKDIIFYYQKVKMNKGNYHITFEELNVNTVLEDYSSKLERDIVAQPQCWLWSHNRWKNKK